MTEVSLNEAMEELLTEADKYQSCMSLVVSQSGRFVELTLDNSRPTYGKWIEGFVGGDCGLICDAETNEVIGITLRLIDNKLSVFHEGPLRINAGFLKSEAADK